MIPSLLFAAAATVAVDMAGDMSNEHESNTRAELIRPEQISRRRRHALRDWCRPPLDTQRRRVNPAVTCHRCHGCIETVMA
eukprot:scaffold9037_cov150-Skeletonema_menzelii.AAC.4